jgi:TetR/AcrR family transcriptional repressor of nem operon
MLCEMGRQIEFNYEKAIERATELFWKKGYSQTSVRHLLKVMRIGEGSFYNSVKNKRALYLQCLKHYNETVSQRRLNSLLNAQSARGGIRAFFKTVLDELDNPKTPAVCLLVRSLSREVLVERELQDWVLNEMEVFASHFRNKLEAGKESGDLPKDFDAVITTQIIMTYLNGLFRMIRVVHNRRQVEKQIEVLLSRLGL